MRTKIGDTLVEVALAIGIFSMVAIVIVSVISASTSNAQTALEVTISREDLDAQAEALRFIHDSYMNDSQSEDKTKNTYNDLWTAIVSNAITEAEAQQSTAKYELNFNPYTCSELYDNDGRLSSEAGINPFIINIRKLGGNDDGEINPDEILIKNNDKTTYAKGVFREATTFPRIIYGQNRGSNKTEEDFYSQTEQESDEKQNIQLIEGIYIIAIKGQNEIIDVTTNSTQNKDTYYDFYIRSCWFPPSAKRASTISTVIRLYDPAAINY